MKGRIIALFIMFAVFTAGIHSRAEETTTTAMRMQPLVVKLSGFTQKDIALGIKRYSDVGKHWAKNYIGKLTQLGIITGSGNGKFKPDNQMSIAEFLKVTTLSLGYKIPDGIKNWAEPYIKQALKDRLIDKNEVKDFNKSLSREQMAKIMVRAITLKDAAPSQKAFKLLRAKTRDYQLISDTYKQFVTDAYLLGALEFPTNGKVNPKGLVTRAQACTVAIRLLDMKARTPFTPAPNEILHIKGNGDHPDSNVEDEFGFMPFTVYPPSNPEVITTANYLIKNCLPLTKGYVSCSYGEDNGMIGAGFCKNFDIYREQDPTKFSMSINIRTDDKIATNMMYPYGIGIMNCKEVKSLHLVVVVTYLKYLLGNDYQKAVTLLNKYINTSSSFDMKEDITLGNRRVVFSKHSGSSGFDIGIGALGYIAK